MMSLFLLLFLGGLYSLRYYRLFANQLQGTFVCQRPLPLLARMRLHAIPALLGVLLAIGLHAIEHAPIWAIGIPVVGYLGLLVLPLSYQLTTEGIRLGLGTFRRWTEFAGARRYRGGAKLQGANGRRGMRIWLSGTRGDDEFLHQIRRAIRDAYKGDRGERTAAAAASDHGEAAMQGAMGIR